MGSFLFSFTSGELSGTRGRGRAGTADYFDSRNVRTFRSGSRRMEGPAMADELSTRDAKLIQYLNEAYGKEKELETALQAHIRMTKRPPYKKRLQDHLKETKAQSKGLERRIKALGGKAERSTPVPVPGPAAAVEAATAVTAAATKAMAAAKGPIHALRGTGEAEKQLKNAKDELWNEYEEIGNYTAIEALAEALNDDETVKLAREYRRQEERMASFLLKLIPTLTKAVVTEEVPAAERRRPAAASGRGRTARSSATGRTAASRASSSRSSGASRSSAASRSGGASRSSSGAASRSGGSARSSGRGSRTSGAARSGRSPSSS